MEVKKLYPDAMLPRFDTTRTDENNLTMVYLSERHLQDVAHGLILGCCKHFGDECDVQMEQPAADDSVRFVISLRSCLATA